jgi:class I fructose-bisphosphate aldolase/fructose-bisphosphate aldolase/2-amino-3,7-dideoxy-D-threo-hept-6-ulosonate synthase
MNGKNLRFGKLFNRGENAVIIAIDHGEFDGPIPGMIDLKKTIKLINPCVDGILLSPGMLKVCREAFNYKGAPIPICKIKLEHSFMFPLEV